MKYLSAVDEIFDIKGRGCILAPGVPFDMEPPIKIGVALEIHNPSGSIIKTTIKGLEMLNRGRPVNSAPVLVGNSVKKKDVEIGAKLYVCES